MIQLPNNKKCYNLPEQVAQNLLNIQYLAEQYQNIDELPSIWADYKTAFDADLHTFEDWTTTFEGWENTLATYLANMSSAAVGAIAGQAIAPLTVAQTQANYSADAPIDLSAATIATGVTKTDSYSKIIVINGVLNVIIHFAITNPTASDVTLYNVGGKLINLPSAIASKVYDFDGSPASTAIVTQCMITMGTLTVASSKSDNSSALSYVNFGLYHAAHPDGNRINYSVAQSSGLTIPAGTTRYFSGRFALTLIE